MYINGFTNFRFSNLDGNVVKVANVKQRKVDFDIELLKERLDRDILKQILAKTPDREVVVIADKGAVTGTLVQVIDACNLSGVKKVSIAAQAD